MSNETEDSQRNVSTLELSRNNEFNGNMCDRQPEQLLSRLLFAEKLLRAWEQTNMTREDIFPYVTEIVLTDKSKLQARELSENASDNIVEPVCTPQRNTPRDSQHFPSPNLSPVPFYQSPSQPHTIHATMNAHGSAPLAITTNLSSASPLRHLNDELHEECTMSHLPSHISSTPDAMSSTHSESDDYSYQRTLPHSLEGSIDSPRKANLLHKQSLRKHHLSVVPDDSSTATNSMNFQTDSRRRARRRRRTRAPAKSLNRRNHRHKSAVTVSHRKPRRYIQPHAEVDQPAKPSLAAIELRSPHMSSDQPSTVSHLEEIKHAPTGVHGSNRRLQASTSSSPALDNADAKQNTPKFIMTREHSNTCSGGLHNRYSSRDCKTTPLQGSDRFDSIAAQSSTTYSNTRTPSTVYKSSSYKSGRSNQNSGQIHGTYDVKGLSVGSQWSAESAKNILKKSVTQADMVPGGLGGSADKSDYGNHIASLGYKLAMKRVKAMERKMARAAAENHGHSTATRYDSSVQSGHQNHLTSQISRSSQSSDELSSRANGLHFVVPGGRTDQSSVSSDWKRTSTRATIETHGSTPTAGSINDTETTRPPTQTNRRSSGMSASSLFAKAYAAATTPNKHTKTSASPDQLTPRFLANEVSLVNKSSATYRQNSGQIETSHQMDPMIVSKPNLSIVNEASFDVQIHGDAQQWQLVRSYFMRDTNVSTNLSTSSLDHSNQKMDHKYNTANVPQTHEKDTIELMDLSNSHKNGNEHLKDSSRRILQAGLYTSVEAFSSDEQDSDENNVSDETSGRQSSVLVHHPVNMKLDHNFVRSHGELPRIELNHPREDAHDTQNDNCLQLQPPSSPTRSQFTAESNDQNNPRTLPSNQAKLRYGGYYTARKQSGASFTQTEDMGRQVQKAMHRATGQSDDHYTARKQSGSTSIQPEDMVRPVQKAMHRATARAALASLLQGAEEDSDFE